MGDFNTKMKSKKKAEKGGEGMEHMVKFKGGCRLIWKQIRSIPRDVPPSKNINKKKPFFLIVLKDFDNEAYFTDVVTKTMLNTHIKELKDLKTNPLTFRHLGGFDEMHKVAGK